MKEGDFQLIKKVWTRQACYECGESATKKHTYLLENCRNNRASSAYGRDDCSWCADDQVFACDLHEKQVEQSYKPDGMTWCATFKWKNEEASPMFYYWKEEKVKEDRNETLR